MVLSGFDGVRRGSSTLTGGWRNDPSVEVQGCTSGAAWAHGRVPAILDGEPHRLSSPVRISYRAHAFRAAAPADAGAPTRRADTPRREVAEAAPVRDVA